MRVARWCCEWHERGDEWRRPAPAKHAGALVRAALRPYASRMSPDTSPTPEASLASDVFVETTRLSGAEVLRIAAFWGLFAAVTLVNRLLDPRRSGLTLQPGEIWLTVVQCTLWTIATVCIFWLAARESESRAADLVKLMLAGALAAFISTAAMDMVRESFFPMRGGRSRGFSGRLFGFGGLLLLNQLVIAMGVVAAGMARSYSLRLRARRAQAVLLQAQLTQARLDALRRQLDPHFLFNTLNAVSALVERDPRGVRRMLSQLSELLRYNFDGPDEAEITLGSELELLDRYVDIMQIRFMGRLDVEARVNEDLKDAMVPALILQPLVENSIRHGVEQVSGSGEIIIEGELHGDALVIRVRDNGPGPANLVLAQDSGSGTRGGVGLRNVRDRLVQLYGSQQSLTLRRGDDGTGAVAEVRLPYRRSSGARSSAAAPLRLDA